MTNTSRRDFLKLATNSLLAATGILGFAGLLRYLAYKADPEPPSEFDIGPAANYGMNSRTVLTQIPAIVIHDDKGLRAMSLTCSHLGCTIEERNYGFECPCHSSRYDLNGIVIKGPAKLALRKLHLEQVEAGNLHIFTA